MRINVSDMPVGYPPSAAVAAPEWGEARWEDPCLLRTYEAVEEG